MFVAKVSGQTNTAATNQITSNIPTNIVLLNGKTYHGAKLLRVEPDGLFISYVPEGGGEGMAKVKFEMLPPAYHEQFKYDPKSSADFQAQKAKATEAWGIYLSAADEQAKRAEKARQAWWNEVDKKQAEMLYQRYKDKLEEERLEVARQQAAAAQRAADAAAIQATTPPVQNINHRFPYR